MGKIFGRYFNKISIITISLILVLTMMSVATGSSSIVINSVKIYDQQNSIQLPAGSQIYLYGAATGGAAYSGNFQYSDKGLETVSDANGNIAAQLAMSSSNQNEFNTNCLYYDIGGIGISGFNSYNVIYGYNNSVGGTQTSVQFNLPEDAFVVVIALSAGGLNHLTVGNIPGFSIDASESGAAEEILIGHAYLSPGSYTVSIVATASTPPGAGNTAVLTGVYEFFYSQISTTGNVNSNIPLWAFNGSYADYNLAVTYEGYSESIPLNFNISQVNDQSQTFTVTENYGGIYSSLSGSYPASFNNPSPFPAVSLNDLSMLKTGKAPPDMSGAQITTGVTITVPAGSFNAIEINNNGEVIYVDASTGLIVEETGGIFGTLGGTLELAKTNIHTNSSLSFMWIVSAIIVIVIIVAILVILKRRTKKSGNSKIKTKENVSGDQSKNDLSDVRIKKLKELHDKGLISDKEYDEQRRRIIENR